MDIQSFNNLDAKKPFLINLFHSNDWIIFQGFLLGLVLGILPFQIFAADHEEIRALARKGQMDSALLLSHRALKANADDPIALFMAAKLSPEGKVSAEYFHRVLKVAAVGLEAEESTFRLGQYYYGTGKYYRSIPFFREYLNKFPSGDWQSQTLYWMGNACLAYAQSVGEKAAYFDSASAYFQELASRQKSDDYYLPLALEGQAKVQMAQGNRSAALVSVDSALENAPEEERAALLLLAAKIRQGSDREQEKRFISQLRDQYPQSPEVRYLRKLNSGAHQNAWRSGTGFPKPITGLKVMAPNEKAEDSTLTTANGKALPSTSSSVQKFTLQLGAFSQLSNAKARIASLSKLGFSPELVENQRNGKPIFQVRLGRFSSLEEASEYALKNLKPHQLLSQPVTIAP